MYKIRKNAPAPDSRWRNSFVRLLLAMLIACGALFNSKLQPASAGADGKSLPTGVRSVAVGGSTTDSLCGKTTDTATGWDTPCDLQYALTLARTNSGITELWLQTGVYYPSGSDRSKSFEISSGLMILGGFTGTEKERGDRPNNTGKTNFTILSGNINDSTDMADNSNQVVTIRGAQGVTILDQVVITNGYATDNNQNQGGGLYISDSKVYISNSKITHNYAREDAGGIFVVGDSDVTLVFSEVTFNEAGNQGGGMYVGASDVTIRNSVFFDNNSSKDGEGAFAAQKGSLNVANAIFYAASGAEQPIEVKTGSDHQVVEISYSVLADTCGKHVDCGEKVDTNSDPKISISYVNGIPVLSLPENSPFFAVASADETPQDIYFIYNAPDPNGTVPGFPYNGNGIPTKYPAPTAVTVYDFSAAPEADGFWLRWETATEMDNLGFNLYRRPLAGGEYQQVNLTLIESQSPGSLMGAAYSFFDAADSRQAYHYRLEALDIDGSAQHFDLSFWPTGSASSGSSPRIFLPLLTH